MAEATEQKPNEVAVQHTVKFKQFDFPSLAVDSTGAVTVASFIDTLLLCLIALNNPDVDELLRANEVAVRDVNGKLFFPRPVSAVHASDPQG